MLMRILIACLLFAVYAHAAEEPRTVIPVEKDRPRHDQFLTVAKAGNIDLLFLGDSITDGWRGGGREIWEKYFAPLKAANFGISGDRTEHVLWRLRNGELDGIHPKLVVMMIGTNNAADPPEDVARGIKALIAEIQQRSPGTRILLLAIFPRNEGPTDKLRLKNQQVDKLIATYAMPNDPKRVVFLDINAKFLTADQILSKEIMPDLLHPNAKGYQIWADAIIDPVKKLLRDDPGHLAPAFVKRPTSPKVAQIEESIIAGNVAIGAKALEKLTESKDATTADEAKEAVATVTAWKDGMDAKINGLRTDGDVATAGDLAAAMAKLYSGEAGKGYKDLAAELRKDPGYAAGKDFEKLEAIPSAARQDKRFQKLVEDFLKKHPTGYYAQQAEALIPK